MTAMVRWLTLACLLTLSLSSLALAQAPGARAAAPRKAGGYVSQSFTVRNVDATTLLRRLQKFGLQLPISASGRVTASVTVDVPWRHLFTAGDYRFHATITSPDLTLEGISLHAVQAAADYEGGVLTLRELRFTLWDTQTNAAAGSFSGDANVQVSPRGDLDARLSVQHLGLATLTRRLAGLPPVSPGEVTGRINARVSLDRVRQLDAWQAGGDIVLSDLIVADLPAARAKTKVNLSRGVLALDVSVMLGRTDLSALAEIEVRGNYPFRIQVRQLNADLDDFAPLVRRLGAELQLTGKSNFTANLSGRLQPLSWRASGVGRFADLSVNGVHVNSIDFDYSSNGEQLEIRRLVARAYQGTATGSATLPLKSGSGGSADIAWRDVQVGSLVGDLLSEAARGGASQGRIVVQIPADPWRHPDRWQATGAVSLENVLLRGISIRLISTNLELRDRRLVFSGLRVRATRGELLAGAWLGLEKRLPLSANFDARNLELADLAPAIQPVANGLAGSFSARGSAQGNLATLELMAVGTGSLDRAQFRGARLDRATFGFALSRYGVNLKTVDARLYGGRVRGWATVPLSTQVAGSAKLDWDNVALGPLIGDLRLAPEPIAGLISGRFQGSMPVGHNFQLQNVSARTRVVASRLSGLGVRDGRIAVAAQIERGELNVGRLEASTLGSRAEGALRVSLAAPFQFSGDLSAAGDLGALPLRPLLPKDSKISGKYELQTDLHGALEPRQISGAGSGSLRDARLDDVAVDSINFQFAANERTLELTNLQGKLYGGSLSGSGVLPIAPGEAGDLTLAIDRLDAGRLVRDVAQLPLKLKAQVAAEIHAVLPQGAQNDFEHWQIDARVDAPVIHVNSVVVGDMHAELHAEQARLTYDTHGSLFGGLVDVRGLWQPPSANPAGQPNAGLLKLTGLQLERLSSALAGNRPLRGLAGRVDFILPFALPDTFGWPTGSGELRISDIRWDGLVLADRMVGRVVMDPGVIKLTDAGGSFAGGRVRTTAAIDVRQLSRSTMTLTVENAQSETLLAAWPSMKGTLSGPVSLHLRGVLARPWRMSGTVEMNDARLMAVALSDVRLPLTILFEPRTAAFEVNVPEGSGQLGHGRMQIRATLRSTDSLALDMQVNTLDADVQALLAPAGSLSQLSGGRATGTLRLSGQNVRSLNDLSGTLDARLRNVQPTGLPLFRQLTPYLTGGLSSSSFDEGMLRARIANGTLFVERLSIASSGAQIYASGRVALSGALDLDVMVSNDQLPGGVLGQTLLARIPLIATGPVGWVVAANQLLANRVVYLDVSGTISSPVIQVRPLPLLANEAARFFLGGQL